MPINEGIQASLAYIDENLKTTLTIDELAEMAGYSPWHYGRLFSQTTGMTVAYYICKRRIDGAFADIADGAKAIEAVLAYGFDTYAGFYKAFVRMYGCAPKQYLARYGKRLSTASGGIYMATERQLRTAIAQWDVPQDLPLGDIYIMDGSKVSGNVWTLGEDYILKAGERHRLVKDLHLQQALARQGFTTAAPVTTGSGEAYADIDADNIVVLMRKTPGAPLGKAERFGVNRRDYGFKYGVSIAKLHCALADVEADIKPDEANLYQQITEWAMPEVKKQNQRYGLGLTDGFFKNYLEQFDSVFDALPKQLVHRDPNPSNILFDGGEVSGFIDFDLSERNVRLWDPCYCATGILSEWRGVEDIHEKWPEVLAGILHGYNSVNPLTDEEKQAVFHVICSIEMICLAYFEHQEADGFAQLAQTNREMFTYVVEQEALIRGIF